MSQNACRDLVLYFAWFLTQGCALALSDNFHIVEKSTADAGAAAGKSSGGVSSIGGSTIGSFGGKPLADVGGASATAQGGTLGSSPLSSDPNQAGGDPAMGGSAPATNTEQAGGKGGASGASSTSVLSPCATGVAQGTACTSSASACTRTCGPAGVGIKTLSCNRNTYSESACSFPENADYSCYALPTSLPSYCPNAIIPQVSMSCQIPECVVCFGGVVTAPSYRDTTGMMKSGYCVCTADKVWSCAGKEAWPCPGNPPNNGC